ncbi:hypothetical protein [Vibrio sp. WZ-1]|uniref:hypothetical protein n=1 Tax=Vibrio sp. WZ-1 TaxID=3454501 RepID=UPI003F86455F
MELPTTETNNTLPRVQALYRISTTLNNIEYPNDFRGFKHVIKPLYQLKQYFPERFGRVFTLNQKDLEILHQADFDPLIHNEIEVMSVKNGWMKERTFYSLLLSFASDQ